MAKKEEVRKLFNDISEHYDFLNHFLSFGTDRGWRRRFVRELASRKPLLILDVATGTGDLAIAMTKLNPTKITGIDIAEEMLSIGGKKTAEKKLDGIISFQKGDAESIPFADNQFDAVTVAFGVRNFEDLEKGLSEMKRVLKPGGFLQILEFSHPQKWPVKQLYKCYSRFFIPAAGKIISKNAEAYQYLPDTISVFPSGKDFIRNMEKAGMINNSVISLTFGVSSIYSGEKPA